MDRAQVRIGVIIANDDMVYRISARSVADVANPAVITKDPLALRVPLTRKPYASIAVRPLTGSHAITSRSQDTGTTHHHRSPAMDWFTLLVGAGIAATAYSSGAGVGFRAGRRKERAKTANGPKLICSCGHGFGSHDDGKTCQAEVKRANKWGKSSGYAGSDHEIGWEYVPCACSSYDGPEPPINVLTWKPPTELPPAH